MAAEASPTSSPTTGPASQPDPHILAGGSLARIAAVPWKNEGGQTRELWVEPPEAGFADFAWRASVADVGRDGVFSTFAGIARTIVLLEGDGFSMQVDGAPVHDLREPFAPFAFAGEANVSVQLHGAPTLDFNLMVRRQLARGELVVLDERNSRRLPDATVLLYLARGNAVLSATSGWQHALRAGDFVRLRQEAVLPELLCAPGAVVLAIRIRPR